MTDQDPDSPNFRAWFPETGSTTGGFTCAWYLSATGAVALGEGSAEISAYLLEAAGADGAEVADWTVTRVCTPFFTGYPDAPEWADRYPLSWRWTVRASGTAPKSPPFDGVPVPMSDPTWRATPQYWVPGEEECEVIGVVLDSPAFADRLKETFTGREVSTWGHAVRGGTLTVGRVRLGRLDVEASAPEIDRARDALADLGAATHLDAYRHLLATIPPE